MKNRAPRQEQPHRRRNVRLDPAVVGGGAVERFDKRAVDRLDTHPHTGRVHVRLEYRQLHRLRQRLVASIMVLSMPAEIDFAGADVQNLLAASAGNPSGET